MNEDQEPIDNQVPIDNGEEYQTLDQLDPDMTEEDRIAQEFGIDPSFISRHEDGSLIIADPVTGNVFMSDDDVDPTPNQGPSNDTPQVFVNKLDEVLKKSGYDISEIDFGDGNIKPISDLTEEEQIEIIVQQLSTPQPSPQQALPDLTEDEMNLVDFLRSGKTPRELAEAILDSDPSYKYSKMSDEDVVRDYLTKEKPSYTPEEIEEEIEDMKSRGTKLAREAKDIRLKFTDQSQIPQAAPNLDYEQEKTELLSYAQTIDVPANVKNDILNFIIPQTKNEDSELIKYMTTPDALFNIGYLLTQFDSIQKNHQQELKQAEERGRKKALGQL